LIEITCIGDGIGDGDDDGEIDSLVEVLPNADGFGDVFVLEHFPNKGLHPFPQYPVDLPHHPCSLKGMSIRMIASKTKDTYLQQSPNAEPRQVRPSTVPHLPSVETVAAMGVTGLHVPYPDWQPVTQ
jgi:hypothetical protein